MMNIRLSLQQLIYSDIKLLMRSLNQDTICVTVSCWSAQFSHQRALSLSYCLGVLNCVSHHHLHLLLVHYCQLVIIDSLASPYKYLVHFVFSCVSIAFCSCVAIFVSCFDHVDYVFWTVLHTKRSKMDLFV